MSLSLGRQRGPINLDRSYTSAHRTHLSAMRCHVTLFSGLGVNFAMDVRIRRQISGIAQTRSLVDLVPIGNPIKRNSGPFERFRPDLKKF